MSKYPSFQWFPRLILCCLLFKTNSVEISMVSKTPIVLNTKVDLKCTTEISSAGMYWILQKNDYTAQPILYISVRSKITPEGIKEYQASKHGDYYELSIAKFEERHQGIYYCLINQNQKLFFSSGLHVYLTESTTQPPTVPTHVSKDSIQLGAEDLVEYPVPETDNGTEFPCETYIWAPLAAGCFLLLIVCLIILSICCDPRRRRRRCRCKRSINGTNGVHPLPRKRT